MFCTNLHKFCKFCTNLQNLQILHKFCTNFGSFSEIERIKTSNQKKIACPFFVYLVETKTFIGRMSR